MNKWTEIFFGLTLMIISIYLWGMDVLGIGTAALEFLKGGFLWIIILLVLFLIVLGISDLKE